MSRIFRQADNVCIWLGEEDENNKKAIHLAQGILNFDYLEAALSDRSLTENFLQLAKWATRGSAGVGASRKYFWQRIIPWLDFVDAVIHIV